jgi:SOS response regulatory protein OraA/RecX
MKGISKADIAAALEEVDPEAAGARMEKLITAKCKSLQSDPFIKFKLIKYALSRGYRYDDVAPAVDRILSSQD